MILAASGIDFFATLVNPPRQAFGADIVTPGHHLMVAGGFGDPEPVRNSEGLLHAPHRCDSLVTGDIDMVTRSVELQSAAERTHHPGGIALQRTIASVAGQVRGHDPRPLVKGVIGLQICHGKTGCHDNDQIDGHPPSHSFTHVSTSIKNIETLEKRVLPEFVRNTPPFQTHWQAKLRMI